MDNNGFEMTISQYTPKHNSEDKCYNAHDDHHPVESRVNLELVLHECVMVPLPWHKTSTLFLVLVHPASNQVVNVLSRTVM